MKKKLLIATAAAAVLFGSGVVVGGVLTLALWFKTDLNAIQSELHGQHPDVIEKPLVCPKDVFDNLDDVHRRFVDLQVLCDFVERPEEFSLCVAAPDYAPASPDRCQTIRNRTSRLCDWLDTYSPPLTEACATNPDCAAILGH